MIVLLPPSERKAVGGEAGAQGGAFARMLASPRRAVRTELDRVLTTADPPTLTSVLGVRGELLDQALRATRRAAKGRGPVLPAWQRYTGVVWEHLDPGSLAEAQRASLLIPSGLYGINVATDPICEYRLKMSARIGTLGVVARLWRPELARVVARRAAGSVVIDLLPAEHAAAIDFAVVGRTVSVIRVRFVSSDGARAIGHEAKAAKGTLARALLDEGPRILESFEWRGWRANPAPDGYVIAAP